MLEQPPLCTKCKLRLENEEKARHGSQQKHRKADSKATLNKNTRLDHDASRINSEEQGPCSNELALAAIISLLFIPLVVLDFTMWRPFHFEHLQHEDRATIPLYLSYAFVVIFFVNICSYMRGFCFKLVRPLSDCREDQLSCVKANIRSWVETTPKWLQSHEAKENRIVKYQERFAYYLADPGSKGAEYWRRSNIAMVIIDFWVHYCCASFMHSASRVMAIEPAKNWQIGFIVAMMLGYFFLRVECAWYGSPTFNAGRLGRALRMSVLARSIRRDCVGVDVEKVDDAKDRLDWWFENLVRSGSVDNGKEKATEREEKKIQALIKKIKI